MDYVEYIDKVLQNQVYIEKGCINIYDKSLLKVNIKDLYYVLND